MGSRRSVSAAIAAIACLALCVVAVSATVLLTAGDGVTGFVTRSGDKLMLNGKAFRFSGANIFWGGLDDDARDTLNYPTEFRVDAALQTVVDMGGQVVRCQSCGISTGNPLSVEPSLGTFNAGALKQIDYFVAQAGIDGLRLDIPLVDSYDYYIGGYRDFTDWLGLSSPGDCPSAACASQFYDSPRAIKAFEKYISVLLNHVNVYTGVANKDNPTIMSWETGNEMPYGLGGPAEFTRWTATISAYIKSIAPHQLVMDGSSYLDPGDLTLPDVDIQSPHFYPLSDGDLAADAALTAAARQALVVGEYAWNAPSPLTGLAPFLTLIKRTTSISGDLYWALLPPNDDFGFVEHFDGYQLHFPGDKADVLASGLPPIPAAVSDASLVADLRQHAYAMAGKPVPPYAVPPAPVITNVERVASATVGIGNLIEWRGAPGAAEYVVRRSVDGPKGPWTVAGRVSAALTEAPWLDAGGGVGPDVWYMVTALSQAGVAGQGSAVFRMQDETLDDNAANFSLAYSHTSGVSIDYRTPPEYNGDGARMAFWAGEPTTDVVWRVPAAARAFEAVVYYGSAATGRVRFLLSADGSQWTSVPATDVQAAEQFVGAGVDRARYIYTIDNVQGLRSGARYVMVQRGVQASGTAEVGEVRITYAGVS